MDREMIYKIQQKRIERLSKRVVRPLPYENKSSGSQFMWIIMLFYLIGSPHWTFRNQSQTPSKTEQYKASN